MDGVGVPEGPAGLAAVEDVGEGEALAEGEGDGVDGCVPGILNVASQRVGRPS